ncbi:MAG: Uncharacterized protein G01um10147_606 [Microgenomates group bacterium Gr01-1014_7]|nr:MAG: Uncharacterized protein G01um10147_606 [Microgenomates group bacterium Gr01-1014_7]
MKQKGLTLIELLVVMAVLAIAGTFIFNIFTSTLRGSNKTQILGVIKQNGQAVLETMDKTIRNSDNVVCPFFLSPTDITSSSNTLVTVKNGIYTRYRFFPPEQEANGLIKQDNPVKQNVGETTIEETDPQFVDRICNVSSLLSNAVFLTDTNPQTGVSISIQSGQSGIFTRNRSSGFKDKVTIKFTVKPGVGVSISVSGQIDPVLFQTTINLR